MVNGYSYPNYNRVFPKTPEQLQNEMQASIEQYQNMFQAYQNPPQAQRQQARRGGEYFEVCDAHEMEESPTRLDGTPALFFDFKNRIFWAKKYVNGAHSIQTYRFEPILSSNPVSEETPDSFQNSDQTPRESNDSIDEIKQLLLKLVEKEEQRGSKRSAKSSGRDNEPAGSAGEGA